MDFYSEILANILSKEHVCITFPQLHVNPERLVEMECYRALREIKTILEDDSLEDRECFLKIEEIVRVFEEMGSDGGNRHDW